MGKEWVWGESIKLLYKWQFPAYWQAAALNVRTVSGEKLASVFYIMENFINLSPSSFLFYSLPHTWHFNILLTDFFFSLYLPAMKTYKLTYCIQIFHWKNLCFLSSSFHLIQITCFLDFACTGEIVPMNKYPLDRWNREWHFFVICITGEQNIWCEVY